MEKENLVSAANWQTKQRGANEDEYQIYVDCAQSLGWKIKTYEEWIKS